MGSLRGAAVIAAPAFGSPLRLTHTAAQVLHLAAQGLHRRPRRRATKHDVLEAIRQMGALQIDTISVVARSPYFVLFSRLGHYDPQWLDQLLTAGRIFEYWAHEASFLPIEDYGLFRLNMLDPAGMGWKYRSAWVDEHGAELQRVLEWVRSNGAVRSADFKRQDGQTGGWWGWKPEKRALEYLLTSGHLMVARRQSFQRVYDLRERVHPSWSDEQLPSRAEADRQLVLRAVHALGVTTAAWVHDYYRMSRRAAADALHDLVDAGELLTAAVDGWDDVAYVHPAHAETALHAADGAVTASLTTLLSPFDPVVWDRAQAHALFGFDYRIECYTPEAKRRYGYFVLPVLRRGALVGRLDAKAHRREGRFEVKVLYLEDGVRASEPLLRDIAHALQEAAAWHNTPEITVTRTAPAAIRSELQRLVKNQDG